MQALFEEHLEWAESLGRMVWHGLPPSFDVEDLVQIARIEHWHRVGLYDPLRNNSYQGYAYIWIKNAVKMATRRRHYREATHRKLKGNYVDQAARPDEILLAREKRRNVTGPRDYRRRVKVQAALEVLPAEDADLVRVVFLEGADVEELERSMPGTKIRISAAVRRLKRLVRDGTPAATATRPPQMLTALQNDGRSGILLQAGVPEPAQLVGECA